MCGISGFFCFKKPTIGIQKKLFDFAEQAAYVGSMRGRDGTGIFQVDREYPDRTFVYKRAIDGACFADTLNFQGAIYNLEENLATVIHNRKGTMGGNTDDMCHPHRIGDITLVHNGTLNFHRTLGGGNSYTSDSAAIAYALDSEAVNATNVLEELDGAFTLIWHDATLKTLNIARNEQRPLSVGFIKDHDVMLYASERGMLEWLAGRVDLKIEEYQAPKVGTHYYWALEGEDVSVRSYGEAKFDVKEEWDYYGTRGSCSRRSGSGRIWNSTRGCWDDEVPSSGRVVQPTGSTSTVPNYTAEISARETREDSLKKFSLKKGDRIKWVVYDAGTPSPISGMVKVRGIDVDSRWEAQFYMIWNAENQIKYGELRGALVESTVHTVVATESYEDWPIIDTAQFVKLQDGYWEEGYDYKREGKEIIVADNTPPWNPPSEFCDCDSTVPDNEKCAHKCIDCAKAERLACANIEQDEEPVSEATVQYQIGQNMFGSLEDWEKATKHGCSECSCDLADHDETYWTYNDEPLCYDCAEDFYNNVISGSGKVH